VTLIDRIQESDGLGNWIQQPSGHTSSSLPDSERAALWVPDPIRTTGPRKLQIHVENGWQWSNDVGRTEIHNRCETLMWAKDGVIQWNPTPNSATYYEVHGMYFPANSQWPVATSGGTYNVALSQTNSNSATSHFFGESLWATTPGSSRGEPGLKYGQWFQAMTISEWTANRGKWIHALNEVFYGSSTNGYAQTTLYVNGALFRTGPKVNGAQIDPNDMPTNRKCGIYRIQSTRSPDPLIVIHDMSWWTTKAEAANEITSGFAGTGGGLVTTASFDRSPVTVLAGQEVVLTDTATTNDGTITDRSWLVSA
jgi:hypothetical protein